MTTGSKTLDARQTVNYGYGATLEGSYYSKSWSGSDASAAELKARRLSHPKGASGPRPRVSRRLPPHPYEMNLTRSYVGNYICVRTSGTVYCLNGSVPTALNTHASLDPRQHYALIEKLRRRAYGSGWHPGIFAAEMPAALRMITSAAVRIRLALKAAAAGNWRNVVRALGIDEESVLGRKAKRDFLRFREGSLTLSQFWLEVQYGWIPLLLDMEDACAYIAHQQVTDSLPKQTRVSARRSWEQIDRVTPGASTLQFTQRSTRFKAQYVITNLRAAPRQLPSLASVASVAWELMPWSFVVDWAVPIGQYLDSLRTAADLKGTVVLSVTRETTWSNLVAGSFFKSKSRASARETTHEMIHFKRTVSDEIIPPSPLPDLSPGSIFSRWERAANAVALLTQLKLR